MLLPLLQPPGTVEAWCRDRCNHSFCCKPLAGASVCFGGWSGGSERLTSPSSTESKRCFSERAQITLALLLTNHQFPFPPSLRCDENTLLREAVDRHLSGAKVPGGNQQSSREKLGAYVKAGVDQLRFFIRHPSRVRGREGDIKSAFCGRGHLALCSLQPGTHSSRVYSWQTRGAARICWGSF